MIKKAVKLLNSEINMMRPKIWQVLTALLFFKKKKQRKTYFFLNDSDNEVKIGKSFDPLRRFAEVQKTKKNPLQIYKILNYDIENHLHNYLSKYRKEGEWFDFNQTVQNVIDRL